MISIEELIKQYSSEAHNLEKMRKKLLNGKTPIEQEEAETISEMLSDLRFSMEWMRVGRRPGQRRGIDKKNIYYQQELYAQLKNEPLNRDELKKLVFLLLSLSYRERQCYLLFNAHNLTYAEISVKLDLSRSTVQKFVERARNKVQQGIS